MPQPAIPSLDGRDIWFHLGQHEYRIPATGGFRKAWYSNKLGKRTVKCQLSQYVLGASDATISDIDGVHFSWIHGPHDPKKCDIDTAIENAKKAVHPRVTERVHVLAVITKLQIQG